MSQTLLSKTTKKKSCSLGWAYQCQKHLCVAFRKTKQILKPGHAKRKKKWEVDSKTVPFVVERLRPIKKESQYQNKRIYRKSKR